MPARRAYLTAGTNRFAFLVPEGFSLHSSEPQQVQLVSTDQSCTLSVSLLPGSSLETLSPASARALLLARCPNAEFINEFSLSAADQSGPAFEVRWVGPQRIQQAARVAFIPSRAGPLLFWLSTSPEQLPARLTQLRLVMLTFCASDARGQLRVLPLSNKL